MYAIRSYYALLFVTILIGILVNAMIVLMAGPIVDRFVSDDVPPPSALRPEVPPEVDAIVMKLLAKSYNFV